MFDRREKQRIELARRAVEIRRDYWQRKAWKFDFEDFDGCAGRGAGEYLDCQLSPRISLEPENSKNDFGAV